MGHYACNMRPEWFDPDADRFRVGDVWQNSRGTQFEVMSVDLGVARLVNKRTGRRAARAFDAIGDNSGWPWVRLSCGA